MQMHDRRGRKGAPVLYYSTDCKAAAKLCSTCQAYFHVAVARNNLMDHQRFARIAEARRERPGS